MIQMILLRTTIKETLIHDIRAGNINIERNKKQTDYSFANAKTTIKETTEDNTQSTNVSYSVETVKVIYQMNFILLLH